MKCTNCGSEIGAGLKFCVSCGTPVATTRFCTGCGAEVASTAAFCGSCGQPSAVGAAAAAPAGTGIGVAASAPMPPPAYRPAPPPTPAYGPPPQSVYEVPPQPAPMSYKGIGSRLVAALIDTILYFVFAWFVAAQTGNTTSSGFDLQGAPAFLSFGVWTAYFLLFEGFLGGTIGKLILGIRVVNDQGRSPGLGAALVRNLLRIVDFLPLFYILGAILVATSKRKQRLGDRVAGTFVVSR